MLFRSGLRAPEDRRAPSASENSSRDQSNSQKNKAETRGSSNAAEKGAEVNSPAKSKKLNKRKGGPQEKKQEYRRVIPLLMDKAHDPEDGQGGDVEVLSDSSEKSGEGERLLKKKKPTPVNSGETAEAAVQPCRAQ